MTKNLKGKYMWISIAALVVVIVVLVIFIPGKETSFNIKDRCGPIMNFISHTIESESICKTRCKSQCDTQELKYSRVEFEKADIGCNTCDCFCREGLF